MSPDEIFKSIKPGQRWRHNFGKGNKNNKLIHIRAIVDEKIVIRFWHNLQWVYEIESVYFFVVGLNSGYLKKISDK